MKILIEIPTWLGDTVMVTPAIENLIEFYADCEITVFGSKISTDIFNNHPNVKNIIIDKTKTRNIFSRLKNIDKVSNKIGNFDIAITFRNSFFSAVFLWMTHSGKRYGFSKNFRNIFLTDSCEEKGDHQVEKYNSLVNFITGMEKKSGDLKIYSEKEKYKRKVLGINPGASYGSAKRWYPERFAEVASGLSDIYDIIIFGGKEEIDIAKDIETILKQKGVKNFINLCGKTSIQELIKKIAGLSLFITNDSGPMHIAAAFKIPSVCIFGPTNFKDTCQWHNNNSIIVTENLSCSPCMKRKCPLGHHNCMKSISSVKVLNITRNLI
jgi:heptosyltransferase-2